MAASNADSFTPTARTQIKRAPKRATYDKEIVHAILDEALYCHVGFIVDQHPFVIPTLHVRLNDHLYIHGSTVSRMIHTLQTGAPVCITVTLLDGLVLARSAYHHSMNYRSVVLFGTMFAVTDPNERSTLFNAFVEHVASGRSSQVRPPNDQESKATAIMGIALNEVSAKVRTGPPVDDEPDYEWPVWAGVVPLTLQANKPIPDDRLIPNTRCPENIQHYTRT